MLTRARRPPPGSSAMSHASSAALLAAADGNLLTLGAASRTLAPPMFAPSLAGPRPAAAPVPRPPAEPALPTITEPLSPYSVASNNAVGASAHLGASQEPLTARSSGSIGAPLSIQGGGALSLLGGGGGGSIHTSTAANAGGSSIVPASYAGSGYAASAKAASAAAQVRSVEFGSWVCITEDTAVELGNVLCFPYLCIHLRLVWLLCAQADIFQVVCTSHCSWARRASIKYALV